MHSNIHHNQIEELPKWVAQMKATMDFWPVAYYPYFVRTFPTGFRGEDMLPLEVIQEDWEYIRQVTKRENESGFPMFMGYEWQGAGKDGDHNVYYKHNDGQLHFPMRYKELVEILKGQGAIGIPHHVAYQLGHRGKNWDTHDDEFSPFVEIYSSHGSSESDTTPIEMGRHIHMGPRTSNTAVEAGYSRGHRFGLIASGDNHACPGVYGFGYCAVLAESNSKEDIWDAFINRRVYGVSKDRIKLYYTLDGQIMGSTVKESKQSKVQVEIEGSNAIDRVEIIKDNRVVAMIPHTSTWEDTQLKGVIRFKFQLELGWGPDRRIFADIESKRWSGKLITPGKLVSIEKCWSNFGQELTNVTDNSCEFQVTSYKTTATGKWMGPSAVTNEGFIFEIEDDISSHVTLVIDGIKYCYPIVDLLAGSRIVPLLEGARELLKDRYDFTQYYRSDPWWHNSYKFKIHQAAPEIAYKRTISHELDTTGAHLVRLRVWQKNGGVAWSSPIFIDRE